MGDGVSAFDADAWAREESGLFSGGDEEQRHVTKLYEMPGLQQDLSAFWKHVAAFSEAEASVGQPASLSVGRAGSGEDGMAADAWVNDPLTSPHSQAFQQTVMDSMRRTADFAAGPAEATFGGSLAVYENAGEVESRAPDAETSQSNAERSIQVEATKPVEYSADSLGTTFNALETSASRTAVQATSSGGGEPCNAKDIRRHPFVRLPVVNPSNIQTRFRKDYAFSPKCRTHSPMESYKTMRSLFAKASLTAKDVGTLIMEAELLVNYAKHKLAATCKRSDSSYVAMRLSSLLMIFDHLVCTIELLGDAMDAENWWTEFVQMFTTDYKFPEWGKRQRGATRNKLANRLSAALSVYKKGIRPEFEEIIELKRAIISSPYADSQLANPLWKLWIKDDREFYN
ncbi:hypothetical protein, conserved [Eimeria brunetti]|uniref:Uncharacterized protein n=1 Tax=Eimeria brunetti TaxID=51314 RepID=U6M2E0_9EIME|nr:hypothetical protein, conserved [Eimeria brunetti]